MIKNVIGLMSGTSMDGVDAAYLKTNGIDIIETGMAITLPYGKSFRNELSEVVSKGLYSKNVNHEISSPDIVDQATSQGFQIFLIAIGRSSSQAQQGYFPEP